MTKGEIRTITVTFTLFRTQKEMLSTALDGCLTTRAEPYGRAKYWV